MTRMYTPANNSTALAGFALVARVVASNDAVTSRTARPGQEHVLDLFELADVVHEALVESQRNRGARGHTLWWDAAEAASLILRHVVALTGGDVDQSDSDSDSPANPGVSRDHA